MDETGTVGQTVFFYRRRDMLKAVLLFLLGFALLIKGGDWFVDGSVGIAHRFICRSF